MIRWLTYDVRCLLFLLSGSVWRVQPFCHCPSPRPETRGTTKASAITRKLALFAALLLPATAGFGQQVALKTNALYWATATPNLSAEAAVGRHHTVALTYGLNPWRQDGGDRTSLRHWALMPEFRHWFCESFNGWFVGAHLMGGQFNAASYRLPFGLFSGLRDHRYEGWFAGGGIQAGYQWVLSRHWNVEGALGLGYDYVRYDKFKCGWCGERVKSDAAHYFGPTKLSLSVVYIF